MFFVEASGSPYEIGRELGEKTKLAIGNTLDMLTQRFRDWDDARVRRVRERHMAYTERVAPELVEEARGIADGSGHDPRWIFLAGFYASMRRGLEGCSNLLLPRAREGPLLARTCDLPRHEGKHAGLALVRPADGMAVLAGYWPGTTWRSSGINEAGLALGGSSCGSTVPEPDECVNPHALPTIVLSRAETVPEAVALLDSMVAPSRGANYAIVDAEGDAAVVEKAGESQAVRRPRDGRLCCTNHAVTEELARFATNDPDRLRESRERFAAIKRLSAAGEPNVELARAVLSYMGRPGAVCRYGQDDPLGYDTEWAFIAQPASGHMEVCYSHPDRDPWHSFDL